MEVYLYKISEMCKLSITVISEPHLTLSRCLFMVDTIVPVLCISYHNEGKGYTEPPTAQRHILTNTRPGTAWAQFVCVLVHSHSRPRDTFLSSFRCCF